MNAPGDSAGAARRVSALAMAATLALVIGVPLAGAWTAGRPLAPLLDMPPRPPLVSQPAFSPVVFATLAAVLALLLGAVARRAWRHASRSGAAAPPTGGRWPWWGNAGLLLTGLAWGVAWLRPAWAAGFSAHTFTPLWLGYILVMNALAMRRRGGCLLSEQPWGFLALFLVSACFWWLFEYLNRYTGNWRYVGITDRGALAYATRATLAFATVLPAFASTWDWLATHPRLARAFAHFPPIEARRPMPLAAAVLAATLAALFGIGYRPQVFFAWLWVAPVLVLVCVEALAGGGRATRLFAPLRAGDWRVLMLPAVAALQCGFFWEMWNWRSDPHWVYAIPYVGILHLFEMPLLGYAGYLPFGVECAAVTAWVLCLPPTGAAPACAADGSR